MPDGTSPELILPSRARRGRVDVICYSHLRWDFVYQRPQHLMRRYGRNHRVFFVEEPVLEGSTACLDVSRRDGGVVVLVPHLPSGFGAEEAKEAQFRLISAFAKERRIEEFIGWYFTPMALAFSRRLRPLAIVYDCMDELSAFLNPPPLIRNYEAQLLRCADLVFSGGYSLHEVRRARHPSIHLFPSSVDAETFARARGIVEEPLDQRRIPRPRVGFYGVVDERFDATLVERVAISRPDWNWVILGPVLKIDERVLPRRPNIHYLGFRPYEELPAYLAGWDVATLPFALNEATRYISPTKTLEYLAAGKPVVSTPIRDVVRAFDADGLVRIADTADAFLRAVEVSMAEEPEERERLADAHLRRTSWEATWQAMTQLLCGVLNAPAGHRPEAFGCMTT